MKSKLIFTFIASISLMAISTYANAAFRIDNGTKNDLSFAINNTCSAEFGTIMAHDHSLISEDKFFTACKDSPHACVAKIYKGAACSGKHEATVVLDIDGGLKTVLKAGSYMYTWNIYNLLISERNT
jgi:hypothetical protein